MSEEEFVDYFMEIDTMLFEIDCCLEFRNYKKATAYIKKARELLAELREEDGAHKSRYVEQKIVERLK